MKKKGFTLIELLAVIIILAILAFILIPVIQDLIANARYAAAVNSVMNYVKGANTQASLDVGGFEDFVLTGNELETGITDEELEKIKYKGKGPTYVFLSFDEGAKFVSEGKFCIWGYSIDYSYADGATKSDVDYCNEKEPEGTQSCDVRVSNAYDTTTNFVIKNVEDLVCVSEMSKSGKTFLGKSVYLAKNIDINNTSSYTNANTTEFGDINGNGEVEGLKTELTTGAGFYPIGLSTAFKGTFEGYAKTIFNLYINRAQDNIGFVGVNNGLIRGLTLIDVNINGRGNVAAVAGNNRGGTINEVIVSGKVNGTGGDVAGIAGYMYSRGVIKSAYVKNIETNGAGIVSNAWYSEISGVVENGSTGGRCTDENAGSASEIVYCSSSVNAGTPNGTLYTKSDYMLNSYDRVLDTYIGGDNDNSGYYFDYENANNGNIVIKTTEKNPILFTLKGSGTEEDPYIIDSYKHFKEATTKSKGNYVFKITEDIDFDSKQFYSLGTAGNPLGSNINGGMHTLSNISTGGADGTGFVSTTNGHTIEGIIFNNIKVLTSSSTVGLVAGSNNGLIKGITIIDGELTGVGTLGSIAGNNKGGTVSDVLIESAKVTGTGGYIGGVVGNMYSRGVVRSAYVKNIETSGAGLVYDGWYGEISGVVESGSTGLRCTDENAGSASETVYCSNDVQYGEANGAMYTKGEYMLNYYDGGLDTYIGGDNDNNGYYFDYENESSSNIVLKRTVDDPITFTLSGTGSAEDPYIIDSYEHYREATTKSKGEYTFKITADIDFAGKVFYSLGTNGNLLGSNINGDMHTLSNIIINGGGTTGFVSITNGHTIEGITFNNIKVITSAGTVGAVAGHNNGLIKGINVINGEVKGTSTVGGIAGNNRGGTITEVLMTGSVTGTGGDVAGIVGYMYSSGTIKYALVRNITVTAPEGAGIVSNGWYGTIIGVVESGTVSYRCTDHNAGAATERTYCSNKVNYGQLIGTSYNYLPPVTVTYTSNGNTIEVDTLTYYESNDVLDTVINGDGNDSGYYFDYDNSGSAIIVVKAGNTPTPSPTPDPGSGEPLEGGSVGDNPPTCVLEQVISRENGIQPVLTCTDDDGAPTIRSQWNVNKNATTNQFSDIGIIKNGSVNGNSKTVRPYWSTSDPISVPTPNTCYYFRFGAQDASGNWSYYVTSKCYYGFGRSNN